MEECKLLPDGILPSDKLLPYRRQGRNPNVSPISCRNDQGCFQTIEKQTEPLAVENSCLFTDNEPPYGLAEPVHPVIVDYFYHKEIRDSENTGKRHKEK